MHFLNSHICRPAKYLLLFLAIIFTSAEESTEPYSLRSYSSVKGETARLPLRLSSSRAYSSDDQSKFKASAGYRYYGTGSKSANSFAPTNVHKSTSSLDTHNYFITSKANSNSKDMDTAGTMTGNTDGGYLTVYESPGQSSGGMMGSGGNVDNGMMEEAFGDMAAETGHGGGYGHGGHGIGGKGCNSALGLLGVLGLAAYLQNVLRNMQNATAGRKRRDVESDEFSALDKLEQVKNGMIQLEEFLVPLKEPMEDMKLDRKTYNKIMQDVFPLLSAVAHARDRLIPIHCIHSTVCLANQVLVKDLGSLGHTIGIRISSAIAKFLSRITLDERAEQIRMIVKAGKMGRNGRNCVKVFPTCNRLMRLPTYGVPPAILAAAADGNNAH